MGIGSRKYKILIIKDDLIAASAIADLLRDLGFTIIGPASCASEAFSLAESHHPDIAILDPALSEVADGIGVAEVLERRFGIAALDLPYSGDQSTTAPPGTGRRHFLPSALLKRLEVVLESGPKAWKDG